MRGSAAEGGLGGASWRVKDAVARVKRERAETERVEREEEEGVGERECE
jgi:hypothetical protein